jgi:hypothetical protein
MHRQINIGATHLHLSVCLYISLECFAKPPEFSICLTYPAVDTIVPLSTTDSCEWKTLTVVSITIGNFGAGVWSARPWVQILPKGGG